MTKSQPPTKDQRARLIREQANAHQKNDTPSNMQATAGDDLDTIHISMNNAAVFLFGMKIAVPGKFAGRSYLRTITPDEYALWDLVDGDLVLSLPLPITGIARTKTFINSYNVKGVVIPDATPTWNRRQQKAQEYFDSQQPKS